MSMTVRRTRRRLTPSQAAARAARTEPRPPEPVPADRAGDPQPRPGLGTGPPGMRLEWHTATMAHLASVYPFHTDDGLGVAGPYMGVNVTGGRSAFHFDPFELYAAGRVTNPNVIVFGDVGTGKSTTIKTFIDRQLALYTPARRMVAILDPKGEYTPLASALGLTVIRLHPGGTDRLNPMDPLPGQDHADVQVRQSFAAALVAGVLGRRLTETEDAVLGWSIAELARTRPRFTLAEVAAAVSHPSESLATLARRTPLELAHATTPLVFALDKLCTRTLAGMFDGPTTVTVDWDAGPGFVLDLSAVFHDREALPLVMLAATSWLTAMLARRTARRVIQVVDEVWAAVRHGAEHFQASLKLSRHYGVSTWLLCHRPSDLVAQADDGTTAAKIAAGLLSDIQTRILFRQPSEQVPIATAMFGLGDREALALGRLRRGRALWRINDHAAVVQGILTPRGQGLCDTDTAMRA